MHFTQIPMPEPVQLIAALGFLLLSCFVAAFAVAIVRRAVRTGASVFGIRLDLGDEDAARRPA